MAYGILAEIRLLSGNPPTSEVSDATINTYIDGADALVNSLTGKSDWVAADTEYEAVELASNLYAAAMILDHYKDTEGKAEKFRTRFYEIISKLEVTRPIKTIALGYRTSPAKDAETSDLVEP